MACARSPCPAHRQYYAAHHEQRLKWPSCMQPPEPQPAEGCRPCVLAMALTHGCRDGMEAAQRRCNRGHKLWCCHLVRLQGRIKSNKKRHIGTVTAYKHITARGPGAGAHVRHQPQRPSRAPVASALAETLLCAHSQRSPAAAWQAGRLVVSNVFNPRDACRALRCLVLASGHTAGYARQQQQQQSADCRAALCSRTSHLWPKTMLVR